MSANGEKRPLPPGWRWARLGEVCALTDSGVWGVDPPGSGPTWPILRSNNIQDGEIVFNDVARRVVPEKVAAQKVLARGDIVVTKSSGSAALIGKCALIQSLPDEPYLFSNFTLRLRLNPEGVHPEYVFSYLHSPPAKAVLAEIQNTTTGLRNLDLDRYLGQLLPLAPLGEQRRIAARLSEQMAQVESMRRAGRAQAEAAEAVPAALLRQVFESEEAKQLPKVRLADVCRFTTGGTPPRGQARYWNGDIPWASPKDIKVFDLVDTEEHITQAALSEASATRLVPPGSVLVVVRGMILARDFPVAVARLPMAVNQDIRALMPNAGVLEPDYLSYALMAGKSSLLPLVAPSAHGTMRLDAESLLDFTFPCPPSLDEQRSIARQIATTLEAAERMRCAAEAQLEAVNALPGALLEEVFGGFGPPS